MLNPAALAPSVSSNEIAVEIQLHPLFQEDSADLLIGDQVFYDAREEVEFVVCVFSQSWCENRSINNDVAYSMFLSMRQRPLYFSLNVLGNLWEFLIEGRLCIRNCQLHSMSHTQRRTLNELHSMLKSSRISVSICTKKWGRTPPRWPYWASAKTPPEKDVLGLFYFLKYGKTNPCQRNDEFHQIIRNFDQISTSNCSSYFSWRRRHFSTESGAVPHIKNDAKFFLRKAS